MTMFASTFRWLQRKRYQYEVTFSLYMLTPIEKFIFNTFIFLFFSMIIMAACLYLPHHINFITNRAWFYYHGEDAKAAPAISTAAGAGGATDVVIETAKATLRALEREGRKVMGVGEETGREL